MFKFFVKKVLCQSLPFSRMVQLFEMKRDEVMGSGPFKIGCFIQ